MEFAQEQRDSFFFTPFALARAYEAQEMEGMDHREDDGRSFFASLSEAINVT